MHISVLTFGFRAQLRALLPPPDPLPMLPEGKETEEVTTRDFVMTQQQQQQGGRGGGHAHEEDEEEEGGRGGPRAAACTGTIM